MDFLTAVFARIGERVYEETGIQMPADFQQFDIYTNPRGGKSCQCKIGCQGRVAAREKYASYQTRLDRG
ncbi:MAG: hypothetical protein ACRERU_23115 [Methylococcales bacterium]